MHLKANNYRPEFIFLGLFLLLSGMLFLLKLVTAAGVHLPLAVHPAMFSRVNYEVLLAGNAVLFTATLVSFLFYRKALMSRQAYGFLRAFYSGMLLKMLACLGAAFLYFMWQRGHVNKPAVLGCVVLYLVYTFAEVKILLSLSKQQKDG